MTQTVTIVSMNVFHEKQPSHKLHLSKLKQFKPFFLLLGTKQNSVDSLAFETLIPKSIIQRYISLLLEHRRIILCGPSGTGKTYLAQKLAEHLVLR